MEYQHKFFNNLYNVTFTCYEFDEFIIVSVPKVGTNFFHSLASNGKASVYNISFKNYEEVEFSQRSTNPVDFNLYDTRMFLPASMQKNPHNKKIYFLFRNPWNKFVSAISQDYFKPFLDLRTYGFYNKGDDRFYPNPVLELILITYSHSTSINHHDYLIEQIKDGNQELSSLSVLEDGLFNMIAEFILKRVEDNIDIIHDKHNMPYLHNLFLLKQKYNHFEFIDIDNVNIMDFLNKKYFKSNPIIENEFFKYENDPFLKQNLHKKMTKEQHVKFNTALSYEYYYYDYLKQNDDSILFRKQDLNE